MLMITEHALPATWLGIIRVQLFPYAARFMQIIWSVASFLQVNWIVGNLIENQKALLSDNKVETHDLHPCL